HEAASRRSAVDGARAGRRAADAHQQLGDHKPRRAPERLSDRRPRSDPAVLQRRVRERRKLGRRLAEDAMTGDQYLRRLLDGQALSEAELKALRSLRERIEGQLARFEGSPRFYYAGSYGKDTIIRANYDLDIVMYWPITCTYSLAALFEAVGREL